MSVGSDDPSMDHHTVVSRSRTIPPVAAPAVLTAFDAPRVQWHAPDGLEIVGTGSVAHVTASPPNRVRGIRDRAESLLADADHDGPRVTRPRLFGGFSFAADHPDTPPWNGFNAAAFILPRIQVTDDGDTTWVTVSAAGTDPTPAAVESTLESVIERLRDLPAMQSSGAPPGIDALSGTPPKATWETQVRETVETIRAGSLEKVVLGRALEASLSSPLSVPSAVARLRHQYPDCYRFLFEPTGDAAFFGAPPERFLRVTGETVETEALAGSVDRGDTPETDARLTEELRSSEKHQAEHRLVVEAIVDQLGQVGSVTVGDQTVQRLTNIQHLQTPLTVSRPPDTHVLDLADRLHPTPAVGGVPPDEALATIQTTESFDRGWYAAPIGWFDADGNGEFAVAIRSAVGSKRSVTMYAGNGIVADSDPSEEWTELQAKYRPLLEALR